MLKVGGFNQDASEIFLLLKGIFGGAEFFGFGNFLNFELFMF